MSQVFPAREGVGSVNIAGPLSGFGELVAVHPTPTASTDFIYGINLDQNVTREYLTGTVTSADGEVVLASGTTNGAYARCIMLPSVTYHPGQGTLFRGTARFDTPQANTRQLFGVTSLTGGYQFGYDGTTFGILHIQGGAVEVQTLTVTVAPAAPGNVTVTLDGGTPVVVAVTASGSTNVAAGEIAKGDYSQASGGWSAVASANTVYFRRRVAGPAGASTFNAGATGTAATFAIPTTGVNAVESFTPQSTWNIDKLDGTGPSGFVADWTKGNVFQVRYQYLGYGNAFFGVENPLTGQFQPVHMVINAGRRTGVVMQNPNGLLMWEVQNRGSGTGVTLRGASAAAFLEGIEKYYGQEHAAYASRTITAATETAALSIRPANVFAGRFSTKQIFPLRVSVAADGTKPVVVNIYKNLSLTAAQFLPNNATSVALKDSAATGFSTTGSTLIYSFTVAKTGQDTQDLAQFNAFLSMDEILTVTALSANNADISVSLSWNED